jgi:hypothetical protein
VFFWEKNREMKALDAKHRVLTLPTVGSMILGSIAIFEVAMHWQLGKSAPNELVQCSAALRLARSEYALHNASTSNQNVHDEEIMETDKGKPTTNKISNEHNQAPPISGARYAMSTIELFRRFVLQPPAPAKVPYNLKKAHDTHFTRNKEAVVIDAIFDQRENGFFVEVMNTAKGHWLIEKPFTTALLLIDRIT